MNAIETHRFMTAVANMPNFTVPTFANVPDVPDVPDMPHVPVPLLPVPAAAPAASGSQRIWPPTCGHQTSVQNFGGGACRDAQAFITAIVFLHARQRFERWTQSRVQMPHGSFQVEEGTWSYAVSLLGHLEKEETRKHLAFGSESQPFETRYALHLRTEPPYCGIGDGSRICKECSQRPKEHGHTCRKARSRPPRQSVRVRTCSCGAQSEEHNSERGCGVLRTRLVQASAVEARFRKNEPRI